MNPFPFRHTGKLCRETEQFIQYPLSQISKFFAIIVQEKSGITKKKP